MSKMDPIDYALQYGSGCRDCADAAVRGVCDLNGTPCNPQVFRAAVKHALKAWRYGIEHGYMNNPFPGGSSKEEDYQRGAQADFENHVQDLRRAREWE